MESAYHLTGRWILVVEDEPLIALEVATLFRSAGAEVVCARSPSDALEAIGHQRICAAVLDYGLGDHDVASVCSLLAERHIPFMFYSGYSDLETLFPKSVVVQKPASADNLLAAMKVLVCPAETAKHQFWQSCDTAREPSDVHLRDASPASPLL